MRFSYYYLIPVALIFESVASLIIPGFAWFTVPLIIVIVFTQVISWHGILIMVPAVLVSDLLGGTPFGVTTGGILLVALLGLLFRSFLRLKTSSFWWILIGGTVGVGIFMLWSFLFSLFPASPMIIFFNTLLMVVLVYYASR